MKDLILLLLCTVFLARGDDAIPSQNSDKCNVQITEAKQICATNLEDENALIAHRFCDMFYICANGKLYPYKCSGSLLFDPVKKECDWPDQVQCESRPISSRNYNISDDSNCDADNVQESDEDSDEDDDIVGGNCDPSEAASYCLTSDSEGHLVAHEICNQFYICSDGKPVALTCPTPLLYNSNISQCDWPINVDCGDRIQNSDKDDNGETDSICVASDSDNSLVAHENCNKFYQCAGGKPVVFKCPGNLLFNTSTNECDWAVNVECGDRVIPDPDEDDNVGKEEDGAEEEIDEDRAVPSPDVEDNDNISNANVNDDDDDDVNHY